MSQERRYAGSEIEEIFERAEGEQAPGRAVAADRGLTLGELQEIGREVGIEPDAVARAAAALDRGALPVRAEADGPLGLPLSVSHAVSLPRDLTEREWERLVAELRETFRAPGRVQHHGGLRQWSNGNLHALVEPTGDGYRLRLGTTKGNARPLFLAGSAMVGMALIFLVLSLIGLGSASVEGVVILSAIGLAQIGFAAIPLPGWARTRKRQMEAIAERVTAALAAPDPGPGTDA